MAKFGDVVASLLREITIGRSQADQVSRGLVDAYIKDPVLSQFPVPRVTVKDMSLRLRFAISGDLGAVPEPDWDKHGQQWEDMLKTKLWPKISPQKPWPAAGASTGPIARTTRAGRGARVAASAVPPGTRVQWPLAAALDGKREQLYAQSSEVVVDAFLKAYPERRNDREKVAVQVNEMLAKQGPVLLREVEAQRQVDISNSTSLQILVGKDDLTNLKEQVIQEITLNLGIDDIQTAESRPTKD